MSSSTVGASAERPIALPTLPPSGVLKPGVEETALDSIVNLSRSLFDVETSVISLIDNDRVWHQAVSGFESVRDIDHLDSFCTVAVFNEGVTVGDRSIREKESAPSSTTPTQFYAAVPLTLCDGNPIGTLAIIDEGKRRFPVEDQNKLSEFGALASRVLELHSQNTSPSPLPLPADGSQLLTHQEAIKRFLEIHQKTFTICAWSKRIRYHGQWMSLEEFLQNCLDIRFTHGLSEDAYTKLMSELQEPPGNP